MNNVFLLLSTIVYNCFSIVHSASQLSTLFLNCLLCFSIVYSVSQLSTIVIAFQFPLCRANLWTPEITATQPRCSILKEISMNLKWSCVTHQWLPPPCECTQWRTFHFPGRIRSTASLYPGHLQKCPHLPLLPHPQPPDYNRNRMTPTNEAYQESMPTKK